MGQSSQQMLIVVCLLRETLHGPHGHAAPKDDSSQFLSGVV